MNYKTNPWIIQSKRQSGVREQGKQPANKTTVIYSVCVNGMFPPLRRHLRSSSPSMRRSSGLWSCCQSAASQRCMCGSLHPVSLTLRHYPLLRLMTWFYSTVLPSQPAEARNDAAAWRRVNNGFLSSREKTSWGVGLISITFFDTYNIYFKLYYKLYTLTYTSPFWYLIYALNLCFTFFITPFVAFLLLW